MSKPVMYKQCSLSRKSPDGVGVYVEVSWLPTKFAVVGKYLEILNPQGEWVNGWHVDGVSPGEREERFINKRPVFGSMDPKARSHKIGI